MLSQVNRMESCAGNKESRGYHLQRAEERAMKIYGSRWANYIDEGLNEWSDIQWVIAVNIAQF